MKLRIMTKAQREGWIRGATTGLLMVYKYATSGNARTDMIVEALAHAGPNPESKDLAGRMTTEEQLCTNLATLSLMLLDAVDADDEEMIETAEYPEPIVKGIVGLKDRVEAAHEQRCEG